MTLQALLCTNTTLPKAHRIREQRSLLESLVHRASLDDLGEAPPLRIVEATLDPDTALDAIDEPCARVIALFAILGVDAIEVVNGLDGIQLDAFVAAVESEGDTGAGGQGTQEQLVRIGAGIGAAELEGFVRAPLMTFAR